MTKPATLAAAGSSENRTGLDLGTTIPAATDETDHRPFCRVVRAYCESLGLLRREPGPSTTCCRHYWAEAVGRHG